MTLLVGCLEVSSTREDILLQVNLSIRIPDIRITWPTNDAPSKPQRGGVGRWGIGQEYHGSLQCRKENE